MQRLVLPLVCVLVMAGPVWAADTMETWDAGAGNFEMYSGIGGVRSSVADQSIDSSVLMGWGVAHRFSAYVGTGLSSDGYFSSAEAALDLGAFGTLYDSDHVDFDLGLNMSVSGPGMEEALMVPAVELNLDRTPGLTSYGAYIRGAAEIAGGQYDNQEMRRHMDLNLTFGSYYSLTANQQILLEYDITVHDQPEPGIPDVERGAVALGYNALINDNLELITEARLDIPQGDEVYDLGFMVGVIATLSSGN